MKKLLGIAAAALLAGVMFALALPPRSFGFLGWIFLVPLLLTLRNTRFVTGFIAGITAAMTAAVISTTPLVAPNVITTGDVSWNYVGFGLYGVVLALMLGFAAEQKSLTLGRAAILACLGVVMECITFIKLPAHLALTQYASTPMLALASITGIWGVSWLLWFSNFALASESTQKHFRPAIAGVALIALFSTTIGWHTPQSPDRVVGAVQTDQFGSQSILPINESLIAQNPDLAVWPELSIAEHDIAPIQSFAARPAGFPIVATLHTSHDPKPHNTAVYIDKSGAQGSYHKRKPFAGEADQITPGTRPIVVQTLPLNVGLNICFDSCYPGVMRDTANAGNPDLIALPTLDPASPNGFIQAAHAAFTPFRAAELGIPIVRAEATAWSMIVDSRGRITGKLPTGHEGTLARSIDSPQPRTIYRTLGDWFLWMCAGVLLATIGNSLSSRFLPAHSSR